MCGPGDEKRTTHEGETTPTELAQAMNVALHDGTLTGKEEKIAVPLRGLCRWLERVYKCFLAKINRLEENTPDNTALELVRAWVGRVEKDHQETRSFAEEQAGYRIDLMARVDKNDENVAKMKTRISITEREVRELFMANETWHDTTSRVRKLEERLVTRDAEYEELEAAFLNLDKRLDAHVRGDIATPFGTLTGPGPLLHSHDVDRSAVLALQKKVDELEGWMNGEEYGSRSHARALSELEQSDVKRIEKRLDLVADNVTHHVHAMGAHQRPTGPHPPDELKRPTADEVMAEAKEAEAFAAADAILNGPTMQRVCPDVPVGLERARPRFCHQCGVKL